MNDSPKLAEWILEQTTDALVYADRDGKIVRWNQAAFSLFGYSAAEALGQSLDLIIPERLRAVHWTGFDSAMASGSMPFSTSWLTGSTSAPPLMIVPMASLAAAACAWTSPDFCAASSFLPAASIFSLNCVN